VLDGVARVKVGREDRGRHAQTGGRDGRGRRHRGGVLAPLPVERLPGVGPKTAARLHAAGIATIGALAALDDAALAPVLPGAHGPELRDRARGDDRRPIITEPAEPVQISCESTYDRDIRRYSDLDREITRLAARVAERLVNAGAPDATVVVKLR